KHITGLDLKDYINQKDKTDYYTVINKPKAVFAQPSKNQTEAARITLKMPITSGETVQTQHAKAKEFFKNAVFGFPTENGQQEFFINTDTNLDDNLKIKCSSYT